MLRVTLIILLAFVVNGIVNSRGAFQRRPGTFPNQRLQKHQFDTGHFNHGLPFHPQSNSALAWVAKQRKQQATVRLFQLVSEGDLQPNNERPIGKLCSKRDLEFASADISSLAPGDVACVMLDDGSWQYARLLERQKLVLKFQVNEEGGTTEILRFGDVNPLVKVLPSFLDPQEDMKSDEVKDESAPGEIDTQSDEVVTVPPSVNLPQKDLKSVEVDDEASPEKMNTHSDEVVKVKPTLNEPQKDLSSVGFKNGETQEKLVTGSDEVTTDADIETEAAKTGLAALSQAIKKLVMPDRTVAQTESEARKKTEEEDNAARADTMQETEAVAEVPPLTEVALEGEAKGMLGAEDVTANQTAEAMGDVGQTSVEALSQALKKMVMLDIAAQTAEEARRKAEEEAEAARSKAMLETEARKKAEAESAAARAIAEAERAISAMAAKVAVEAQAEARKNAEAEIEAARALAEAERAKSVAAAKAAVEAQTEALRNAEAEIEAAMAVAEAARAKSANAAKVAFEARKIAETAFGASIPPNLESEARQEVEAKAQTAKNAQKETLSQAEEVIFLMRWVRKLITGDQKTRVIDHVFGPPSSADASLIKKLLRKLVTGDKSIRMRDYFRIRDLLYKRSQPKDERPGPNDGIDERLIQWRLADEHLMQQAVALTALVTSSGISIALFRCGHGVSARGAEPLLVIDS